MNTFKPYAPIFKFISPEAAGVYSFLEWLTSLIFSLAIAIGIVSFLLSIILFAISAGNQRIIVRSQFWLLFGAVIIAIGGLIWTVYKLTQQFF